jgi:triacylglycerol esterase/lipase EstA (alpha/beta hydrolase family)
MSIRNIIKNALIYVFFIFSFLPQTSFANTLSNWQDPKAYKPRPVLLLHGFSLGSPASWQPSIAALSKWFSKYQIIGPYLETIDFQDPLGSVDTYPDSRAGWADKVKNKVNSLLSSTKYGFYTNKLNLVCHSMGGLAAREYLTNPKYPAGYVDKLILIGVPNLGAPLATYTDKFADVYKIGSFIMLPPCITMFIFRNNTDATAQYLFIPNIETSEALEDMSPDSNFLSTLNNRPQPPAVQYYGIYGIIGHFLNSFFFKDYYGGDGIVSKKSQLGEGRVTFFKAPRQIPAFHTAESAISVAGDNPLLKFLDSTKPELEITSPDPTKTTEIITAQINIKGKVYKEYLPADSRLNITVTRQEDGYASPAANTYLKASDLWIPNNSASPVAEFDEIVNFPGSGTYKISCQVKNPADVASDIKDVWVKVTLQGTYIVVHAHSPEGKEIASIQGMSQGSVGIYDGNTLIGYGAYNAQTHNKPIAISLGNHTIKAVFNGMTKEQTITLNPNETKVVTFVFERVSRQGEIEVALDAQGSETFEVWGNPAWDWGMYNFLWHKFAWIGGRISDYHPGKWRATVNTNLSSSQFHMDINFTEFEGRAFDCWVLLTNWDYGCEVESLIPSRTDFNRWFVQGFWGGSDKSQLSTIIIKEHKTDWQNVFDITPSYSLTPQYFMDTIPANKTYNSVGGRVYYWEQFHRIFGNIIARAFKFYEDTGYEYYPMTLNLIYDSWKFSSVPYDLTGSGI